MNIYGFQKTTLLDYPGHVASTLFTGGCNYRCPYCHNSDLVLSPHKMTPIPLDDIFAHLKKRQGVLDGVCITGGEPTLSSDLENFIARIKEMGYKIKLDTNGTNPDMLVRLHEKKLLDYVAMDIKHSHDQYNMVCNMKNFDIAPIDASVSFLMQGELPYEFRTTVVRELHTINDFESIGKWIAGANAYYLQPYRKSEQVIRPIFTSYSAEELNDICSLLRKYITNTNVRGIDL